MKTQDGQILNCMSMCFDKFQASGEYESMHEFEVYGEVNDMGKWGTFEFNTPYLGETIEKINEVVLPKDYIEFMKKHNGGEDDIGETWLILYPLEELKEINDDYEIEEFLRGHIIIGSNGGGELYGIDNKGNYFNVPVLIDEDDVVLLGADIELLPDTINALWE